MTAVMQRILKQYEDFHMSVEDIALESSGEFDEAAIKSVLFQYSKIYRDAVTEEREEGFSKDEAQMAKEAMVNLMQSTDDDYLKFRTAKYIRDDHKGRLDIGMGMNKLNIDVIAFNEAMKKVGNARQRTIAMSAPIEVESEKVV